VAGGTSRREREVVTASSATSSFTFEARHRLHAGERLLASGQRATGDVELQKVLDFYRSVGATAFVERAEALLAEAQRDSA
jgi:hypothetical protein